jgi:RNA polymerase sigma-70 factor (ECF subfamily)
VHEHQEGVFRFAYLHLGNRQDAEDVAQETFLRAYRSIQSFDHTRPLRPWLLSITANLSRNRKRAFGRYWAALKRLLLARPQSPAFEASSSTDTRIEPVNWDARKLKQAVEGLPERYRSVIYLRFFLDLSVAESAQVLKIAEGTVKSRTHRALANLRGVIERDYPELGSGSSHEDG